VTISVLGTAVFRAYQNNALLIFFRHHVYEKQGKDIQLKEVGPRFELRLYQIKLGTVDISEAENEWVLRPYLTTAKRRDAL
jgi:U3 small nucleolar ribonucleoprotein protein IMP4